MADLFLYPHQTEKEIMSDANAYQPSRNAMNRQYPYNPRKNNMNYGDVDQPNQTTTGTHSQPGQPDDQMYAYGVDDVDSSGPNIPAPLPLTPPPTDMLGTSSKQKSVECVYSKGFKFSNHYALTTTSLPLPILKWGDNAEVWAVMKKKDASHIRHVNMLSRHPDFNTDVRPIVLCWITEVCESHRLHRETFHLTIDIIDRYLGKAVNVRRQHAQLLGLAALCIAAKFEEIHPPDLAQYVYLSDGACTAEELLLQEKLILQTVQWELHTITANTWSSVYLQILCHKIKPESKNGEATLENMMFTGNAFVQVTRMLDLCLLDIGSHQFTYGQLAAAVIYQFTDMETICKISGYRSQDLVACILWMLPLALTVHQEQVAHLRTFEGVPAHDRHNIQTTDVNLSLYERAMFRRKELMSNGTIQFFPQPMFNPAAPVVLMPMPASSLPPFNGPQTAHPSLAKSQKEKRCSNASEEVYQNVMSTNMYTHA